jgi:hypothetical protein
MLEGNSIHALASMHKLNLTMRIEHWRGNFTGLITYSISLNLAGLESEQKDTS